jgi:tetratricopeptide (TPR) repeat protein
MSIVTHKYMTEQMPEEELLATFAARQHTLDFLVEALRQQIAAKTLSSYLVTGPRGAGKSMLLRMLRLRIQDDVELRRAWLPVAFPEEQFNVASVRDLLAVTIKLLAEQNVAGAAEWLGKVEAESDDDQSQELAIAGLMDIAHQQGRRFVLFIENLDEFFEYAISDEMKGTLRRLLMTDPFMMIVGSAVHIFNSLRQYDQAFFNYFCPVPLPRLSEAEVIELLQKRAHFDQNDAFLRLFPQHRPKIAAIAHLSGGNPRLILMLYELLSQRQVGTIVQELRRLVDELTPLLKHELENLPAQQQKIIHALMEKGGTASPADLTGPTRVSLSAVTMQLRRLKESQILELRGGGKGRRAYYTVPDKLFSIWYQMRCLGPRRRQIELFVEVIRIWFEAEDRLQTLSALAVATPATACVPHETALTAEYFAASLVGTPYEERARSVALQQWIRHNDLREAAFAHAEFSKLQVTGERAYETAAYAGLGNWLLDHGDLPTAIAALENASQNTNNPEILLRYGLALGLSGNHQKACEVFSKAAESASSDPTVLAQALNNHAVSKSFLGDNQGELADYTAVVELDGAPKDQVAKALFNRGVAKGGLGNHTAALEDFEEVLHVPNVSASQIASVLFNRGVARLNLGNLDGALEDWMRVLETGEASLEDRSRAAQAAYEECIKSKPDRAQHILDQFVLAVASLGIQERINLFVQWLANLASPATKAAWPAVWRTLVQNQPSEIVEALSVFEPVCKVLEGAESLVLDALPPERRDFALKVLERFGTSSTNQQEN